VERYGRRELVVRGGRLAGAGAALALGLASDARAANVLDELDRAMRGPLLRPGKAGYAGARKPWNARFDDVLPRAVAQPLDTGDVQAIVRWAAKHHVQVGIRSGGHSYAGLSSTIGLLVDLSRLSMVRLEPGGTQAQVGAGATLGRVYSALWTAGQRTIPAGSCPTVGVAGLTLGGGHGFVARAFGLACDSLRGARIVTADGRAHDVSPNARQDLFWALRGGGAGSFGVVTRLTFATRKVGTVTTFAFTWPWAAAADAVATWQTFMATAPDVLTSSLALRVPVAGGMPTVAVNGLFLGPRDAAVAAVAALAHGEPRPTTTKIVQRTYAQATSYFAGGESERRRIAGSSRVARALLGPKGRDALVEAVELRHADPRLSGGGVVLFAFGGAVGRIGRRATAYVHRDARFSLELVGLWTSPSPGVEAANLAWVRHARLALAPFTSGEALQNYADRGLAGWKRAYYAENLERLVAVKRAVDPTNRFHHAQSIPTRL
jgi:FAD/FMN-containing dehydrogenase